MLTAATTLVEVTPPAGHPLGGYLSRHNAVSTGTHDPLTATLLHLCDHAGGGVLWVTLDALGIEASTADRIRRGVATAAGVSADTVLVCASHTHSGPDAWLPGVPPSSAAPDLDGSLVDDLVDRLVAAAAGLGENRRPVAASWSTVTSVGVGMNRNDPGGPHDDSAGVLALRGEEGEIVAVVVDYACHPTVLGHDNLRYSADFPGAARAVVAAALRSTGLAAGRDAAPPVVAFLQGAAGDVSTRFTRRAQSFAEAARLGGMLGAASARGALAAEAGPCPGAAVVRRDTVELPVRSLPTSVETREQVARAEAACRRVAGSPATPQARIAQCKYEGALVLNALREADLPATMRLPFAVVAFGDVAWVHLPVELFDSFRAAITAASPFPHTRVVGYTDGYFGYVADATAHANGTYEALSSFFDAAAGTTLVDASVRLLKRSRMEMGRVTA